MERAPPRPRPWSGAGGGGRQRRGAFPPAVSKVTIKLPLPPGSGPSGSCSRCPETPGRRAAKGRLREADAGRQYAPSRPALARSLPPGFQAGAGSGPHPSGSPTRGQPAGPGASSLLVTPCYCRCVPSCPPVPTFSAITLPRAITHSLLSWATAIASQVVFLASPCPNNLTFI